MRFAEVAVDAPIGIDRTLTYSVPLTLRCVPGQLVWAPLGRRPVQGVVFELTDQPQVDETRPIQAAIEPAPLVSAAGLGLARWMSRYYFSSLFEAVSLLLPPGFKERVTPQLRALTPEDAGSIDPEADAAVWRCIAEGGPMSEREAVRSLGKGAGAAIGRLERRRRVERRWELPVHRLSPAYHALVRLQPPEGDGLSELIIKKKAPRQAALLEALEASGAGMPVTEANKSFGAGAVEGLERKGLLAFEWVRVEAGDAVPLDRPQAPTLTLTQHQSEAVDYLEKALEGRQPGPKSVLLHGVTGSGKTEVYLRALEGCVARGRKGILLVPEISLTPQMVHQVNQRFPGRVAVMHSGLTLRTQFDWWWRMREGAYDVVVGPRSALFSPLPDVGLIVVDEEHEWTYKSVEVAPLYHARDVALKLGRELDVPVLMGSATPDVVTYHRARRGRHRLFHLPERISRSGVASESGRESGSDGKGGLEGLSAVVSKGGGMPGFDNRGGLAQVSVVDMREELKEGNRSPFSRSLWEALEGCVERGEQAILFLNRRGAATLVQCRDCGHVERCRSCSVSLTYHGGGELMCHQCSRRSKVPSKCPGCTGSHIRYLGLGTQRVMEEMSARLPRVSAMRWDRDAARGPGGHQELLDAFTSGMAQVVVGTQMVAKGLHVPNVSLVGVVLADVGLHLPDFRAGERAFQLLCQVAGRAGRGEAPGRVIIQTYNPEHYAVQAASRQDYLSLYNKEMEYRREQGNPPLNRLVKLTFLHTNEVACQEEATRLARELESTAFARGLSGLDVIGPAPGHPLRARGRYRWHVVLRGREPHALLAEVTIPRGWSVDVDPVSVL